MNVRLPSAILGIGTAVPSFGARQSAIHRWMAQSLSNSPSILRWLRALYAFSGVQKRHACVDDMLRPVEESRLAPGRSIESVATTAERMKIYERESVPLGEKAALNAIGDAASTLEVSENELIDSISHLIVVSCTGFFAPGLDLMIARRLGLSPRLSRTVIGFMGCSAMFNGLRSAHQIVAGDPQARVLVVSVELCSIHIQPGIERENLVSASLFADGSSACLVGTDPADHYGLFEIEAFYSEVKPDTSGQMVWQIGDHGFELKLSPQIPAHLAQVTPSLVSQLFPNQRPGFWAIHPGGPAIVSELAAILGLTDQEVSISRQILSDYGNLSSATILFVLDRMRQTIGQESSGIAMAFGPGLVVEMARLHYRPNPVALAAHPSESAIQKL